MIRFTCPHCGCVLHVARREDLPTRPFCCARCQQVDLGKWLNGEYVVSDSLLPTENPAEAADRDAPDGKS